MRCCLLSNSGRLESSRFGSDSFHFNSFRSRFAIACSIIRSLDRSVYVTFYPVGLDLVRRFQGDFNYCTPVVHAIDCLDQTVRLPYNFVIHRVLIVLPLEVSIDKPTNETTPTAISREQPFWRNIH